MGSPFNDASGNLSTTAISMFNSALGIGAQLAGDAAQVASTLGKTEAATKITAGIQTFQNASGPIADIEQIAASVLSMVTTLFHSHAAIKAPTAT